MRVDNMRKVFGGALHLQRDHGFRNQLRGCRPDDVYAQNLTVLGIGDDLHEALVLANDAGAGVGREGEFADLHLITEFVGLGFRQPDAADLGMAVGGVGNAQLIDRLDWLARDMRDGNNAFHRARVRKLRVPDDDIADGVNPWLGSTHILVRFYEATFNLDLGLLNTDVVGIRCATDGYEHLVGFDLLPLAIDSEADGNAVLGALDSFNLGIHEAVDSALAVHPHQFLGDFFVFHRHVARQHLQNGHIGPERFVDAGELDTYRSRADHDERLGNVSKAENFDIGQDAIVGPKSRQKTRDGARRKNDVLGFDGRLAVLAFHSDGVYASLRWSGQLPISFDDRDFVLPHQELEALGVLVHDALLALLDVRPVRGHSGSVVQPHRIAV